VASAVRISALLRDSRTLLERVSRPSRAARIRKTDGDRGFAIHLLAET
jgi:hypothetical protein